MSKDRRDYDYEDLYRYAMSCDCNAPTWTWDEITSVVEEVRILRAEVELLKSLVNQLARRGTD